MSFEVFYLLFLDFLIDNGLNVWKESSTRDVICLEFGYGAPSYEKDKKTHQNAIKNIQKDDKLTDEEKQNKIAIHELLIKKADENKDKYIEKNRNDLRTLFYTEGVSITYKTYNNRGKIIKEETIYGSSPLPHL